MYETARERGETVFGRGQASLSDASLWAIERGLLTIGQVDHAATVQRFARTAPRRGAQALKACAPRRDATRRANFKSLRAASRRDAARTNLNVLVLAESIRRYNDMVFISDQETR